ncbi:hypothetical protein JTX97_004428, partial [Escherichia coli]|nr:hypothetical protein [Escherichia coli]
MNNPLEAVTQAVNSLVTALKLPDESAKANEVLGEMSFPQFSRLLPYRDYNQESGLFMVIFRRTHIDAFFGRVISDAYERSQSDNGRFILLAQGRAPGWYRRRVLK